MNTSRPPFSSAALAVALTAAMPMVGCVGSPFEESKIDPTSSVAADVARLTRDDAKFPTFAGIPSPPTDIRPLAQYSRETRAILAEGAALAAATAPATWTLSGTEAFAEKGRRDAGPQIDPPKPGDAEAFARELRERATPPPPR
jgi:hypothetical protein